MAKITARGPQSDTVVVKTRKDSKQDTPGDWWNANSKTEMKDKLLGTVSHLKELNQNRGRQASIFARMYGNTPLFGWVGSSMPSVSASSQLPIDRPTMSVVTSCVDTIVSSMTQSKPRPVFLTDNGDYKQRKLAKQLNGFTMGEFYRAKAYMMGEQVLRDASVLGTGVIKVLRDQENRVSLERRICTELMVDSNDAIYGTPRQLYELKLVDRSVLATMFDKRTMIENAEQAYPDTSGESSKTVSDLVMVVEAWRLASGPEAGDGLHAIACSEGVLFDESWAKKTFPFAFLHYSPRLMGFWGQGLPERQMGTQVEINKLLMTMSKSINLMGVPRVFIEDSSKFVKSHFNNNIGSISTYRGTAPMIVEGNTGLGADVYAQLERLVRYAYEQEGISQLSANSQKPSGLNSGAALREYDDIQSARFTALQKRYEQLYIDTTHLMIDEAISICKETGSYETVFPDEHGARTITLPSLKQLENPFVIQCFEASSLPKEPAGRLQWVTEMMQAGVLSPQEGRRLLNFPDTEQVDRLANAGEERIFQILDAIVEDGKYTPPDPFIDLVLATQLCTQYINLYMAAKLEEDRAQMLRQWFSQVQSLQTEASAPMPGMPPGAMPPANPEPTPSSDLLPNVNSGPASVQ